MNKPKTKFFYVYKKKNNTSTKLKIIDLRAYNFIKISYYITQLSYI